ncbi:c-type cytochrome, partial [Acinetobacter baumannii]
MVAGILYFFLSAGGRREAALTHTLRPDDPQVLQVGARIYAQNCVACHGTKGEGQPNWRDR